MDPAQQQQQIRDLMQHLGPMVFVFWGGFYLVKMVLYIIPMWQTCKKAGISPAVAFIAAVPLIGRLIANYVIAFSGWNVTPVAPYGSLPPQYPPPAYQPPSYPPQGPRV